MVAMAPEGRGSATRLQFVRRTRLPVRAHTVAIVSASGIHAGLAGTLASLLVPLKCSVCPTGLHRHRKGLVEQSQKGAECGRWESNPHGLCPLGFKSSASSVPPRPLADLHIERWRCGWRESNPHGVSSTGT